MGTHYDAGPGSAVPVLDGVRPNLPPAPDPVWMTAAVRCQPGHVTELVSQCRALLMSLSAAHDNASRRPASGDVEGEEGMATAPVDPVAVNVSAAVAAVEALQADVAEWRLARSYPDATRSALSRSERARTDMLDGDLAADPRIGALLEETVALAERAEAHARQQGKALLDTVEELERAQRACEAAKTVLGQRYVDVRHEQWRAQTVLLEATATVHGRSRAPESWATTSKSATGELAYAAMASYPAGQRRRARDLVVLADMPHTLAALIRGDISQNAVKEIYSHVKDLSPEDRAGVDADLADLYGQPLADARLGDQAEAAAMARDPEGVLARQVAAITERRVTTRMGKDGLARVTAALPVPDAAAVTAALDRDADQARGDGLDQRSRQQVRADSLVEAITGTRAAAHEPAPEPEADPEPGPGPVDEPTTSEPARPTQPGAPPGAISDVDDPGAGQAQQIPPLIGRCPTCHAFSSPTQRPAVELQVIITDRALFAAADDTSSAATTPARLNGQPIPPELVRRLVKDPTALVALRRLYLDPTSRQLASMDSRRRTFDGVLRKFIQIRDQTCRAPFSGAPIRHLDHADPHRNDGATTAGNGAGLCESANYLKETGGITVTPVPDPQTGDTAVAPAMRWNMPSGRQYTTRAPRLIP